MRTRHILTALALPALFAACTADEFESVGQNNGLQEERAKLSKDFTLMTSVPQTRYSAEGGSGISFTFEQDDQIGAAIIDRYIPGADPEDFEVIPSLAGNNPFEYQGNDEWKSNTQLGIGHYLFVYPYNPNDNNRAAVAYQLPTVQEMYTDENGEQVLNAAIERKVNGNKAVAAAILQEGETVADVSLKNLFTYPKLTINFDNGEDVTTVSQIVLKYTGEGKGFLVKGGFNHKVVAEMFNPGDKARSILGGYYRPDKVGGTSYVHWDEVATEDFLLAENGTDAAYTTFEYSNYIIVKFPKNTKLQPAANTNNKYVEARIMMPSIKDFTENTGIELQVYTDNGVYKVPFYANFGQKDCVFTFGPKTTKEDVEPALQRNRSNGLTLKALTNANRVSDVDKIVTTLEDWNNLVDLYGDSKQAQSIAIVGEGFAFDETAKWPTDCVFTINTDVDVEGDVEMSNVKVNNHAINVKKGAVLTVNNTLEATKIVNEGTVEIIAESDRDNEKAAYSGIGTIENKAVLNVAEDADVEFYLENGKNNVKAINDKAIVTNNGEMQVRGFNYGTIDNNGVMSTVGFTNSAAKYEDNDPKKPLEYMPTINNAKAARLLSEAETLTNYGMLVNEGTLTCQDRGGKIENNRTLDSKAGAVTYITKNTGSIVVYSANTSNVTVENQNGQVLYETSNASENFKGSLVNSLIASDDLTITETDAKVPMFVTFEGNATLKLTKDKATIAGLAVEAGTVTLGSDVTVSYLNVAEGAEIVVPAATTLTYTSDANNYTNEGRILVGGKFLATGVNREDGGLVENNGGTSEIKWAPTAVEEALEDYNAAITEITQAWVLWTSVNTWADVDALSGTWNADVATTLSSGKTWNTLFTEALSAYNALQTAQGLTNVDDTTFEPIMEAAMKKVIDETYKTYGSTNMIAAFEKLNPNNEWIKKHDGTNAPTVQKWDAFVSKSSDDEISEITTLTGAAEGIAKYFAEELNAVALASIDFAEVNEDDADLKKVQDKAIWLSLQAVEGPGVKKEWLPEYSYVRLYEGADEYEVIYALKHSGFGDWFKKADGSTWTFETLANVQAAVAQVQDAANGDIDGVGTLEKKKITDSKLTNYTTKVLDWKFADYQIKCLNDNIE